MFQKIKNFLNLKIVRVLFKMILTIIASFLSYILAVMLPLFLTLAISFKLNTVLTYISALLFPTLIIPLIHVKSKKKVLKLWTIGFGIYITCICINIGIIKYDEKITIDTNININCNEYLPFEKDSKIVKLGYDASLKLKDNLPILDGAAAVFPVYSAFVNATYPNTVTVGDDVFKYNNTVRGYNLLAEKKTDIFFGAYPSKEQIEYAKENNTEFEYTKIGSEAFVFFVHKDNPVDNLTKEQLQGIYSGKITNWKEVSGKNEEIVAFQRNQGSGSQSMLIRFMEGIEIMEAPTEQVNDFMVGIINKVSNYKNKTSSIGFSFRYYLEGIIQNPDVKTLSVDGIKPTIENIKSGKYSSITPLYAVTYKGNENANVQRFLDWVLSSEGQEIIEKTGYVGVK